MALLRQGMFLLIILSGRRRSTAGIACRFVSCPREVAQRVADELDTFLGAHVGYLIRFEDCRPLMF